MKSKFLSLVKYLEGLGINVFIRAEKAGGVRGAGTSDLVIAGGANGASGLDADVYQPLTDKISGIIDGIVAKDNQADIVILDLAKTSVRPEDLGDLMEKVLAKNASRIRDVIVIPK